MGLVEACLTNADGREMLTMKREAMGAVVRVRCHEPSTTPVAYINHLIYLIELTCIRHFAIQINSVTLFWDSSCGFSCSCLMAIIARK